MKLLEEKANKIEPIEFPIKKFLPVEVALENHSVIVCGKTETALRWAEKFLKNGFITAIQFDEIPEKLLPYKLNIRYLSNDFDHGDRLDFRKIVAIATGDPELDQILATKYHNQHVDLIMSETPSRFVNFRFPDEEAEFKTSLTTLPDIKGKPVIKVGIFKDDYDKNAIILEKLNELNKNFPEFHFKLILLQDYDIKKYHLENYIDFNTKLQKEINRDYTKGFNVLYKEDIDLVLIDGKTIPNFYSPDIEFWPTLVERYLNDIIMVAPKEINSLFKFPKDYKIYFNYVSPKTEFFSLYYLFNKDKDDYDYPDYDFFNNSSEIKSIIEKNPKAIIITSFNELMKNANDDVLSDIIKHNFKIRETMLTPLTLDGFILGISRKDNPSHALKLLKIASQDKFPEQSLMFDYEQIYKSRMEPYFGRYFDYYYSGSFVKTKDEYCFKGYAETKHGIFNRSDRNYKKTMKEAINDMIDHINYSVRMY